MSDKYYGWTNRQTFDVYRWIVSDSNIAKYYDQFIERLKADDVEAGTMLQRVGDDMKELISEQLISTDFTSDVVRQLANNSFMKVDWKEIAKSWIKCVPVDFEDVASEV
jgi:hypothetical protein